MSHSASRRKSEVGFVAIGGRKLTSRQQSRSRDGKQKSAKKEIKQGALHLQMFAEKREILSLVCHSPKCGSMAISLKVLITNTLVLQIFATPSRFTFCIGK